MHNTSPLHTYHLVTISPWPIIASIIAGASLLSGLAIFNHSSLPFIPPIITIGLIAIATIWWRDVVREATVEGHHTFNVQTGISIAIIMFIASEVIFFLAFFWSFFHSSLAPTFNIGAQWPPTQITPLNPFSIPLLNTGVLLSSGITVTWAHHSIIHSDNNESQQALTLTFLLGAYFTLLQLAEYNNTEFSFNDSVYGSTFFLATGFHGLHVIIGSSFLAVSLLRIFNNHFSAHHHFGFEAAAWYWHFVDVVWIFLFTFIYWWGS